MPSSQLLCSGRLLRCRRQVRSRVHPFNPGLLERAATWPSARLADKCIGSHPTLCYREDNECDSAATAARDRLQRGAISATRLLRSRMAMPFAHVADTVVI